MIEADLTTSQKSDINYYLSKKWGLEATMDSDSDGVIDSLDGQPFNAESSLTLPDFSDTVDTQISQSTGLSSLENSLVLWLIQ